MSRVDRRWQPPPLQVPRSAVSQEPVAEGGLRQGSVGALVSALDRLLEPIRSAFASSARRHARFAPYPAPRAAQQGLSVRVLEQFPAPASAVRAGPRNDVTSFRALTEQGRLAAVAPTGGAESRVFDRSGLTDLMRGRDFMMVARESGGQRSSKMIINDSVNKHNPTALLIYDPQHSEPEMRLRPLLEHEVGELIHAGRPDDHVVLSPRQPYCEHQDESWCGLHSVNALCNGPVFSKEDFRDFARTLHAQSGSVHADGRIAASGKMDMSLVVAAIERAAIHGHPATVASTSAANDSFRQFVTDPATPIGAGVVVHDPGREHFLAFKKADAGWQRLDSLDHRDTQWSDGQPPVQSPIEYIDQSLNVAGRFAAHFEVALVTPRPHGQELA